MKKQITLKSGFLTLLSLALASILSACGSITKETTINLQSKQTGFTPYMISSTAKPQIMQSFRQAEPDARIRLDYTGAVYLPTYKKVKPINFPFTITKKEISRYSKPKTIDDWWYPNSDGTHSKQLINPQGQSIGSLTSSAETGLSLAFDINQDRHVDLLFNISPKFEEDVLIGTELGQSVLRDILKGKGLPCASMSNSSKANAATSLMIPCGPTGDSGGFSGGKNSTGARTFSPFGDYGSMGDRICGSLGTDVSPGTIAGGDGVTQAIADSISEWIDNGTDGERDGGAARAGRAIISPPIVALGMIAGYAIDTLVTNPIKNPTVWDATNPVLWVAVAFGVVGEDGEPTESEPETPETPEEETDVPNQPEDDTPEEEGNDASQPGNPDDQGLEDYCRARNESKAWWYKQTNPSGYITNDCDDAVVNPNPAAKSDAPMNISCPGSSEDVTPVTPADVASQCGEGGFAGSLNNSCPGVPNSPGASLWYGLGDTLLVDFDPSGCPAEICTGRPDRP